MSNNKSPLERFLGDALKAHEEGVKTFGEIGEILWKGHKEGVTSFTQGLDNISNFFWNMQHSRLLTRLNNVFLEEGSLEKEKKVELTSTRGGSESQDYEYAVTHAQPDDKGLWYREVFSKKILSPEKQENFIAILKEAMETNDEKLIREVVKSMFRFFWTKMGTGLTHKEIEEVVNSLDSFESPFIVPVEKTGKEGIYLMNETTGPTDAFKDLALQQIPTMLSIIIRKRNEKAVKQALKQKNEGISYKFQGEGENKKLVKYINNKEASENEQENRPEITIGLSLTSTSGDTGPAGGSGVELKDFIMNIIGFPANEATQGQVGQMMKLVYNVFSVAFQEAFSDIQANMKELLSNPAFRLELQKILEEILEPLMEEYGIKINLSFISFNSVNIGRIDAQSNYHAGGVMIAKAMNPEIQGEIIEAIPIGNFGHAIGNLQAKDMVGGIKKIIVSSNENDAIYQLIKNGKYRMAYKEVSDPSVSMIIRYGSNIERLLRRITSSKRCEEMMKKFELDGKLSEKLAFITNTENLEKDNFMEIFDEIQKLLETIIKEYNKRKWEGVETIEAIQKSMGDMSNINLANIKELKEGFDTYFTTIAGINLTEEEKDAIKKEGFVAYKVNPEDELETMRDMWLNHDRLICPHTANAVFASQKYQKETGDTTPIVVSETASPWKFLAAIATALTCEKKEEMRSKYEKLRPIENTQEGKEKLLKMIKEAYKKEGKRFDENIIPQDLRKIYKEGVKEYEVYSAKDFGEVVLDIFREKGGIFKDQIEKLIEKMKEESK